MRLDFSPDDKDRLIKLLRSILRINTENPPGKERPVAEVLAEYLVPLGFETRFFEAEPDRTSLLAVLRGEGGGRSLIMNGHIDIGPIGDGWTVDPLGGEIINGKIYGRGTGDMKSGIAAMICAAENIVKAGMKRRGDLYLACVADESSGGHKGSGYLIRHADIKADMGVVCEPTGGHIGIAHRGVVWVRITVHGKPGQAARPWSGVNAIGYVGKVISALEVELPELLCAKTHRFLPPPTFSFGTIAGGIKTNVIAARCTLTIDRRTLPGETVSDVLEEIERISSRAVANSDVKVTVEKDMAVDASEIPADSEVVRECREAFRYVVGQEPRLVGAGGFTDAHWFSNDLGIPTAIFGPWYLHLSEGSVSDIPDEFNYVDDIVTGTKVYSRLIANVIS